MNNIPVVKLGLIAVRDVQQLRKHIRESFMNVQ